MAGLTERIARTLRTETRRAGLDDRRLGGPVVPLRGAGDRCPAHPTEDRYGCIVCAEAGD